MARMTRVWYMAARVAPSSGPTQKIHCPNHTQKEVNFLSLAVVIMFLPFVQNEETMVPRCFTK